MLMGGMVVRVANMGIYEQGERINRMFLSTLVSNNCSCQLRSVTIVHVAVTEVMEAVTYQVRG
jgi:hypothetical protein